MSRHEGSFEVQGRDERTAVSGRNSVQEACAGGRDASPSQAVGAGGRNSAQEENRPGCVDVQEASLSELDASQEACAGGRDASPSQAVGAGGRNAVVMMARVPRPGATKTRLMPDLTGQQCADVHERFIRDGVRACLGADATTFLAYTPDDERRLLDETLAPLRTLARIVDCAGATGSESQAGPAHLEERGQGRERTQEQGREQGQERNRGLEQGQCCAHTQERAQERGKEHTQEREREIRLFPQHGEGLGERMFNVMKRGFDEGFERCVLVGSDVPEVSSALIDQAFSALDNHDAVIGPTKDGGYYLFAAKDNAVLRAAFSLEAYGHCRVFEETMGALEEAGVRVAELAKLDDIDTFADAEMLVRRHCGKQCRLESVACLRAFGVGAATDGPKRFSLSIIVPVYNEAATIVALQDHLRPLLAEAEVVLVDGGSVDGTQDLVSDEFLLVSSPKGRARQMNAGAAVASGDVLMFLHADSILPDGAVGMIQDVMRDHDWGCFGIRFDRRAPWLALCAYLSNRRALRGVPFGDQGIFITRELFEEAGRFPEIDLMEDYQFSLTLREAGHRIGMAPRRIETSARRFPRGPVGFYRVLFQMAMLRRAYRNGVDPSQLAARYRDIR